MTDNEIQEVLDNLGKRVSILAEENRNCKTRDEAGRALIHLLSDHINKEDWLKIYQMTDDIFVKDLMIEWGSALFPEGFER